jgi:broad specificity phosphatase PhoE
MVFTKIRAAFRAATRSKKFMFETEDYDATLPPKSVTVIIFIRHGTSCANVRNKKGHYDFIRILDPGLTRKGIYDARKQGKKLRGKLISNYGTITPIVYTSVLLRTQMTGYLMMNHDLKETYKVHILAYISEDGNVLQEDNTPRNFIDQQKMLDKLQPTFVNMEREGYTTYKEPADADKLKPNFPMFIEELKGLCNDNKENKIGLGSTTRCSVKNKIVNISEQDTRTAYAPIVIVTHGHVLEEFFETMGRPIEKSDRPNFSAFRVYFNNETGKFIKNPIDTSDNNANNHKQQSYFYRYDDTPIDDVNVTDECEYEKSYPACESDVCDPSASVKSTMHIGGRTRKRAHALLKTRQYTLSFGQRVRRKGRKRTQKNS